MHLPVEEGGRDVCASKERIEVPRAAREARDRQKRADQMQGKG